MWNTDAGSIGTIAPEPAAPPLTRVLSSVVCPASVSLLSCR
jgi:hypothetical protein